MTKSCFFISYLRFKVRNRAKVGRRLDDLDLGRPDAFVLLLAATLAKVGTLARRWQPQRHARRPTLAGRLASAAVLVVVGGRHLPVLRPGVPAALPRTPYCLLQQQVVHRNVASAIARWGHHERQTLEALPGGRRGRGHRVPPVDPRRRRTATLLGHEWSRRRWNRSRRR